MTLSESKNYFYQAEKEGFPVPDIEFLTDEEIIKWASENGARGDAEL